MKFLYKHGNKIFFGLLLIMMILLLPLAIKRQREFPPAQTEIYEIDERVRISSLKDTFITVKDTKIFTKEEYMELAGTVDSFPDIPQRYICAHFIIENEDAETKKIEFNSFPISYAATKNNGEPFDMYASIDYSEEEGKWEAIRIDNFTIQPKESKEIYYIVGFLRTNDPGEGWETMDHNDVFLTISYYPTHQKIRLIRGKIDE